MKQIFVMLPRRAGKTTYATYEFAKDPYNSLYVTLNTTSARRLWIYKESTKERIISYNNFTETYRRLMPQNVILDEYLFFENRKQIYKEVYKKSNVYVFTTTDRIYNKHVYQKILENKKQKKFSLLNLFHEDLVFNFLTDPETVIIDALPYQPLAHPGYFSNEVYKMDILNKYLSE
jgi:hypothetical protein